MAKPREEFNLDRSKSDGLYPSCRDCCKIADRERIRSPKRKLDNNRRNRKYYRGKRSDAYRKDPVKYLYDVAKDRAKALNLPFTIGISDIKLNEYCPILGTKLDVLTNNMETGMSLDKVDNTKGYVPGNIAIISRKANRLKGDGTITQFESIIKYMRSYIG